MINHMGVNTTSYPEMRLDLDEALALDIWAQAAHQRGGHWLALVGGAEQLIGVRQRWRGDLSVVAPQPVIDQATALFEREWAYYPVWSQPQLLAANEPASAPTYDGVLATTSQSLSTALDSIPLTQGASIYMLVRMDQGGRNEAGRVASWLDDADFEVVWQAGLHPLGGLLLGGLGHLAELAGQDWWRDRRHFQMRRDFVTPGLPIYARTYLLIAKRKVDGQC